MEVERRDMLNMTMALHFRVMTRQSRSPVEVKVKGPRVKSAGPGVEKGIISHRRTTKTLTTRSLLRRSRVSILVEKSMKAAETRAKKREVTELRNTTSRDSKMATMIFTRGSAR